MSLKKSLALLGTLILLAVILVACGGKPEPTAVPTVATEAPVVKPTIEVPYQANWEGSAHNNVTGEQFRHWDDATENPDGVPTSCAKCHSTKGYMDYIGADGSEANKTDASVPAADAQGVQCVACHNPVTLSKTTVMFPSGVTVTAGDDSRCMECHQGRESKVSVDKQINETFAVTDMDAVVAPIQVDGKDVTFGFRNVHYFAAAATLYGSVAHGGYEYDGMIYDAKNTHVDGFATCTGCHDPHTLEVKVDKCAECHEGVATVEDLKKIRMVSSEKDYDGDGNIEEGIAEEIAGLQEILMAEMQKYALAKGGAEIKYDAATYPYFMGADGKAYGSWTARLLKAAYNYQVSIKDPGAFAHGPKYIIELLNDSIADLGGDVSKLARTDAGHFAGNTMPFRDWDESATGVPFGCVKCHTAQGLPTFLKNGGSVVVTGSGSTVTTGVANLPPSNGFMCSTCHDTAEFPNRLAIASVTFPSGKTQSLGGKDADGKFVADDSNLCISCHQGRESTTSMNNALKGKEDNTVDAKISFKNIHYLGAGATLFGGDAAGAYQYADKEYVGQNLHASETGKINKCLDCHDAHALEPKVELCQTCHDTSDPDAIRMSDVDYDGDGDVTEGIKGEIDTLSAALYAEIQNYAAANSQPIVYSSSAYPYFFVDADKDGNPDKNDKGTVAYNGNWTPTLLRAAYNYQYSQKDPGAFVHNPKYVIQFLIDSIENLGGDVSKYTRPEVPAAK